MIYGETQYRPNKLIYVSYIHRCVLKYRLSRRLLFSIELRALQADAFAQIHSRIWEKKGRPSIDHATLDQKDGRTSAQL